MRFTRHELIIIAISFLSTSIADRRPLWIDERITFMLVKRYDLIGMLTDLTIRQPHPPGYFILIDYLGPVSVALLSMIAFAMTAIATGRTARIIYSNELAAIRAATLIAISPFLARQAGWLRMYSFLTMFAAIGLYLSYADDDNRSSVSFAFAAVFHVFGWFLFLWQILKGRDKRSAIWFIGVSSALVIWMIPKLVRPLRTTAPPWQQITAVGHGVVPSSSEAILTLIAPLVGTNFTLGAALIGVLVTGLVLWDADYWLLVWIVLPVIIVITVSVLVHPIYRPKYFGFIAPAVAIAAVRPERPSYQKWAIALGLSSLIVAGWMFVINGSIVARRFFVHI